MDIIEHFLNSVYQEVVKDLEEIYAKRDSINEIVERCKSRLEIATKAAEKYGIVLLSKEEWEKE